jgi:hypothetical protein
VPGEDADRAYSIGARSLPLRCGLVGGHGTMVLALVDRPPRVVGSWRLSTS